MSQTRKVGKFKKKGASRKRGGWMFWPDRKTAIQENNARKRTVAEGMEKPGQSYMPSWYQRTVRGYPETNDKRNAYVRKQLHAYAQLYPTASLNAQALRFINAYEQTRKRGNTARLNQLTKGTKRVVGPGGISTQSKAKNVEAFRLGASPRGIGGCENKIFNYATKKIDYSTVAFLNMYVRYAYKQLNGEDAKTLEQLSDFSKELFSKMSWDSSDLFALTTEGGLTVYAVNVPLLLFASAYNFFEFKQPNTTGGVNQRNMSVEILHTYYCFKTIMKTMKDSLTRNWMGPQDIRMWLISQVFSHDYSSFYSPILKQIEENVAAKNYSIPRTVIERQIYLMTEDSLYDELQASDPDSGIDIYTDISLPIFKDIFTRAVTACKFKKGIAANNNTNTEVITTLSGIMGYLNDVSIFVAANQESIDTAVRDKINKEQQRVAVIFTSAELIIANLAKEILKNPALLEYKQNSERLLNVLSKRRENTVDEEVTAVEVAMAKVQEIEQRVEAAIQTSRESNALSRNSIRRGRNVEEQRRLKTDALTKRGELKNAQQELASAKAEVERLKAAGAEAQKAKTQARLNAEATATTEQIDIWLAEQPIVENIIEIITMIINIFRGFNYTHPQLNTFIGEISAVYNQVGQQVGEHTGADENDGAVTPPAENDSEVELTRPSNLSRQRAALNAQRVAMAQQLDKGSIPNPGLTTRRRPPPPKEGEGSALFPAWPAGIFSSPLPGNASSGLGTQSRRTGVRGKGLFKSLLGPGANTRRNGTRGSSWDEEELEGNSSLQFPAQPRFANLVKGRRQQRQQQSPRPQSPLPPRPPPPPPPPRRGSPLSRGASPLSIANPAQPRPLTPVGSRRSQLPTGYENIILNSDDESEDESGIENFKSVNPSNALRVQQQQQQPGSGLAQYLQSYLPGRPPPPPPRLQSPRVQSPPFNRRNGRLNATLRNSRAGTPPRPPVRVPRASPPVQVEEEEEEEEDWPLPQPLPLQAQQALNRRRALAHTLQTSALRPATAQAPLPKVAAPPRVPTSPARPPWRPGSSYRVANTARQLGQLAANNARRSAAPPPLRITVPERVNVNQDEAPTPPEPAFTVEDSEDDSEEDAWSFDSGEESPPPPPPPGRPPANLRQVAPHLRGTQGINVNTGAPAASLPGRGYRNAAAVAQRVPQPVPTLVQPQRSMWSRWLPFGQGGRASRRKSKSHKRRKTVKRKMTKKQVKKRRRMSRR